MTDHPAAEQVAAAFNEANPVGTPVRFWPGARVGDGRPSKTRGNAWVMPSGDPVVLVDGYAGGIALTHVAPAHPTGETTPVPTPQSPARPTVYPRDLHLAENLSPEQEAMRDAIVKLERGTGPDAGYEYTETVEVMEGVHYDAIKASRAFAALLNAETAPAGPAADLQTTTIVPADTAGSVATGSASASDDQQRPVPEVATPIGADERRERMLATLYGIDWADWCTGRAESPATMDSLRRSRGAEADRVLAALEAGIL